MSLIQAYRNRGITKDVTVLDGNGAAITAGSSDLVRIVIGREGRTGVSFAGAEFMVVSGTDTANGSSVSKNTPTNGTHRVRFDADDLDFAAGTYTLYVDYFDFDDDNEWKNVSRQVFNLQES